MIRIPRFSPSFSLSELRAALGWLRAGQDEGAVGRFEQSFAEYIGAKHGVMVASARMAAHLILKGWGLQPGDEVLLPGLTYFSIPSIMIAMGVTPVFVDIDPDTYLMDPRDLERKITPRSKVVVPTHLYGFPCPMDPILKLAWATNLKVLEDCAQATGARYHGKRLGSFGDATYYTFGLTKNITTLRGGMITTDDDGLAAFLRQTLAPHTTLALEPLLKEVAIGSAMMVATDPRIYPWTLHQAITLSQKLTGQDLIHERFGEPEVLYTEIPGSFATSKPRGLQGVVGSTQLTRIDMLNGMRASHGRYLLEHLSHAPGIKVPKLVDGAEPIFMSFPLQVPNRAEVAQRLLDQGVDTSIGYMSSCGSLPIFAGKVRGNCPHADRVAREILHIPVHPNLNRDSLTWLAEAVRRAVKPTSSPRTAAESGADSAPATPAAAGIGAV